MMTEIDRLKGETAKPNATLKLIESVGVSRAARKLGVSNTTLHNARKNGVVSRVIEVASTGLLEQEQPAPAKGEKLYLIEIPADKEKLVHRLLEAMGVSIVVV